MLKLFIHKILFILIITFLMTIRLDAKEPILAILESIVSNDMQKFKIGNNSFYCEAYGIISLRKIQQKNILNALCLSSIGDLYKKQLNLKYYTKKILKVNQQYRLEFKKNQCIVYASGQKTLSEVLLEKGLAVVELRFQDKEYKYLFKKAQLRAKVSQIGLWSENIRGKCLSNLVK